MLEKNDASPRGGWLVIIIVVVEYGTTNARDSNANNSNKLYSL